MLLIFTCYTYHLKFGATQLQHVLERHSPGMPGVLNLVYFSYVQSVSMQSSYNTPTRPPAVPHIWPSLGQIALVQVTKSQK